MPYQTSGVIEAGVGCKLIGGSLVCGRGGGGLLDRKILPRKRKETTPVQKKPSQGAPAAKKTSPNKSITSSGSKSKSTEETSGASGETEVPIDEPADADAEDAQTEQKLPSEETSGPPQEETPPAPSPKPAKGDTAAPVPEPEPALGSAEIPDDIRAAACGPGAASGACACPAGSTYDSDACKAALPSCCSATVSADGTPQPAISRCGADQNKAMSAVVSSAMEKKLTLGPVRCTNR